MTFHCPSGLVLDGTNSLTCITKAHSDWDLEVNDLDSEVICSGIITSIYNNIIPSQLQYN